MSLTLRCLDTGYRGAAYNMAVDMALLAYAGTQPVLRFYGWSPPAISCGRSQKICQEFDVARCQQLGVDLVRRPTGGRAVLHWNEITYSLAARVDDVSVGGSIEETNRIIAHCLVTGLRLYGVEVGVERSGSPMSRPRQSGATPPCFSSTARWEVTWKRRKLVGSAQCRSGTGFLQHGSLPIGSQYANLANFLPPPAGHLQQTFTHALEEHSVCLESCIPGNVNRLELLDCLRQGFGAYLDIATVSDELTAVELDYVEERLMVGGVEKPFSLPKAGAAGRSAAVASSSNGE